MPTLCDECHSMSGVLHLPGCSFFRSPNRVPEPPPYCVEVRYVWTFEKGMRGRARICQPDGRFEWHDIYPGEFSLRVRDPVRVLDYGVVKAA